MIEPFVDAQGNVATLSNPLFTGAPGAPALLGTAPQFKAKHDGVGINLNLSGHNAIESQFNLQG